MIEIILFLAIISNGLAIGWILSTIANDRHNKKQ